MIRDEKYTIELDLDRDRIKTVLETTYKTCVDMLGIKFNISVEDFVSQVNKYIDSNRVTIPVTIFLPSDKYPDLRIEVNLRKKSVIARMKNRKKRIFINRFLTKL